MIDKLKESYYGKKVFLTGHTGFKGAWLLNILTILGAEVKGYSLAPENLDSLYNLIDGDKVCESVMGDICDAKKLKKELIDFQPDFIFHLAAQPLVRKSYEIPTYTFEVNTMGTANLLDAIRTLNKPCICVMITTDKVYHNMEKNHYYSESDRLGGFDPYSASKACAELVIDSYKNSYFSSNEFQDHHKSISIARAGNVIGGGDWASDRIIPDIVRALTNNRSIVVRNPYSIRPWQHVLEPLVGYLILAGQQNIDPIKFAQAYNFGPMEQDLLSVEDLVRVAIDQWGDGTYTIDSTNKHVHEAGILQLRITKALTDLAWKPKLDSSSAINLTIDWYREFNNKPGEIKEFTTCQIKNYLNIN